MKRSGAQDPVDYNLVESLCLSARQCWSQGGVKCHRIDVGETYTGEVKRLEG